MFLFGLGKIFEIPYLVFRSKKFQSMPRIFKNKIIIYLNFVKNLHVLQGQFIRGIPLQPFFVSIFLTIEKNKIVAGCQKYYFKRLANLRV